MNTNNQLKFNSNAVVDNLYLVNLVHDPEPILIENRSNLNRNPNDFYHGRLNSAKFKNSNSNFEFIDEEKLSIYSYLIQRDLKTKEYLNKFELEQFEKPIQKPIQLENNKKANKENKSQSSLKSSSSSNFSQKTSIQTEVTPRVTPPNKIHLQSNPKVSNDVSELKKCCDDSVKSIENLESQLNQCKTYLLNFIF